MRLAPSRRRAVQFLLGALWVILVTVLQLARQRGAPSVDTLWAEDGALFYEDAVRDPFSSILTPAGGYLHLVPRLVALLASSLPIDAAAWTFSVVSALLVSVLSLYVFFASKEALPSTWSRALLAGLMVLLPAAGFESVANAANVQYFFLFAAFWALVHRPATWSATVAGSFIAAITALSTTISFVLLPLGLWRAVKGRKRLGRTVAVAYLAALAVQGFAVFRAVVLDLDPTLGQYPVRWTGSEPLEIPALYGLRVLGQLLVGDRLIDEAWRGLGWVLPYASLALLLALCARIWRSPGPVRGMGFLLLGYSALFFTMPVLARGTAGLAPTGGDVTLASNRYVLGPMLFVIAAVLLLLDRPDRTRRTTIFIRISVIALLLAVVLGNFSVSNPRSAGPRWSTELGQARATCQAGARVVDIPITPVVAPPGWEVVLVCDRLVA